MFVFLDGVGIGTADPTRNPLAAADLPTIMAVTHGVRPVLNEGREQLRCGRTSWALMGVDASLEVPGRPQSGTGQTALLTGRNAPALIGRHFGPWVPTQLRDMLAQQSIFRVTLERGYSVAFANAYPGRVHGQWGDGARRPGAFPFAAAAAGVLTRDERSLRAGDALLSSLTTERWRLQVDPAAPVIVPEAAGRTLASISTRYDLTVFAHFDTDYVGHRGSLADGILAIERVDRFLGGLLESLSPDTLLLVTSDHGNLEDMTTGHTHNPSFFLARGPGSGEVMRRVHRISDVMWMILDLLGGDFAAAGT